jgi:predicted RNA methylase
MRKKSKEQLLGQFMTPLEVAHQMCAHVKKPAVDWVVLDPSCGDGNLLIAAAEKMLAAGVKDVVKRLIGFDIDSEMASKCRQRLALLIGCKPEDMLVFNADFLRFTQTDGLDPVSMDYPLLPNVVLANPPYGDGREYEFFEHIHYFTEPGTEIVFLVPLSFIDRVHDIGFVPLRGRPLGVTTGHAIIWHTTGNPYQLRPVKSNQSNSSAFQVLSGVKLYEVGAGNPPQTSQIVASKPFSSEVAVDGWLPCLRTGDIQPFMLQVGRLWVNYNDHLAHPKNLSRFTGPKLFIRRVPAWATRTLAAVYCEELVLCAGDVLVIKHEADDINLLKGLCVFLNSTKAANYIFDKRPSVKHRMSFPKISAKDLNTLLEHACPSLEELLNLAESYPIDQEEVMQQ